MLNNFIVLAFLITGIAAQWVDVEGPCEPKKSFKRAFYRCICFEDGQRGSCNVKGYPPGLYDGNKLTILNGLRKDSPLIEGAPVAQPLPGLQVAGHVPTVEGAQPGPEFRVEQPVPTLRIPQPNNGFEIPHEIALGEVQPLQRYRNIQVQPPIQKLQALHLGQQGLLAPGVRTIQVPQPAQGYGPIQWTQPIQKIRTGPGVQPYVGTIGFGQPCEGLPNIQAQQPVHNYGTIGIQEPIQNIPTHQVAQPTRLPDGMQIIPVPTFHVPQLAQNYPAGQFGQPGQSMEGVQGIQLARPGLSAHGLPTTQVIQPGPNYRPLPGSQSISNIRIGQFAQPIHNYGGVPGHVPLQNIRPVPLHYPGRSPHGAHIIRVGEPHEGTIQIPQPSEGIPTIQAAQPGPNYRPIPDSHSIPNIPIGQLAQPIPNYGAIPPHELIQNIRTVPHAYPGRTTHGAHIIGIDQPQEGTIQIPHPAEGVPTIQVTQPGQSYRRIPIGQSFANSPTAQLAQRIFKWGARLRQPFHSMRTGQLAHPSVSTQGAQIIRVVRPQEGTIQIPQTAEGLPIQVAQPDQNYRLIPGGQSIPNIPIGQFAHPIHNYGGIPAHVPLQNIRPVPFPYPGRSPHGAHIIRVGEPHEGTIQIPQSSEGIPTIQVAQPGQNHGSIRVGQSIPNIPIGSLAQRIRKYGSIRLRQPIHSMRTVQLDHPSQSTQVAQTIPVGQPHGGTIHLPAPGIRTIHVAQPYNVAHQGQGAGTLQFSEPGQGIGVAHAVQPFGIGHIHSGQGRELVQPQNAYSIADGENDFPTDKKCEPKKVFNYFCNVCTCSPHGHGASCSQHKCAPGRYNPDGTLREDQSDYGLEDLPDDETCIHGRKYRKTCNICECVDNKPICSANPCEDRHPKEIEEPHWNHSSLQVREPVSA
ncbi:glutenin, high molecular weight subunit DY10 isoform X2 [Fopius arisanus]|uniref:Glutenin, high molecular weight subunit DY10 isoform X2 n=2 Tax=Fopius arisanus TaxID=64838 RepID=A0A9R1TWZ9_9HYME|nr:PREDICTED: glutenin, high molecular weight subunit DY10-like isoform X2 [Fopius arisanus]